MVITQTPLRVSFFGGGTDYPAHFRRHGGATLVATIDHYTTITVHRLTRFADHSIRVHYSRIEAVNSLDEVQHPSARESLRAARIDHGIEIHYVNDLPARTGLGSSSSATVGLLHALHAFKGEMMSRAALASEAVHVEQDLIRERVGSQDQYACAYGGFLHLRFPKDGAPVVEPVVVRADRLTAFQSRLMLLYTGLQRHAHEVLDEQLARTEAGTNDEPLARMTEFVSHGLEIITGDGDLGAFGALLHDAWVLKRQLSTRITTRKIDEAYGRARSAGAIGGKLLGAGGGGFLLLYVEPDKRDCVKRAVPDLREVDFAFETQGTQVILYRPPAAIRASQYV